MSSSKLLSATSIAALLFAGAAMAQSPKAGGEGAGAAPTQHESGSKGGAGMSSPGMNKGGEMQKGAERSESKPGEMNRGAEMDKKDTNKSAQGEHRDRARNAQSEKSEKSGTTTGAAQNEQRGEKAAPNQKMGTETNQNQNTQNQKMGAETKPGTGSTMSRENAAGPNATGTGSTAQTKSGTSSQTTVGATGSSINLTPDQRTKIRETVLTSSAPRVDNVNFSVHVGTVVPRSVHVVEVPTTLVDIHPEWRGYRYFVVHDQIVIVEPDSLRIVAVLDV
jgi:hypothetical protein